MKLFRLLLWTTLTGLPALIAAAPPNVIVLMTDDQGYGELSAHGNPVIRTPHLDQLHDESIRFTDFHVAPMCTPTRGQLMSGLDAARNGAINVSSGRTLLRAGLPTLATRLRDAGYRTGMFGKWHLGDTFPYRPMDRGFEATLWFPSSHVNSTPDAWDNDYFHDDYRQQDQLVSREGYCTDVFFNEALEWMGHQAREGRPFFCYLPTNAPHWPHWVPDTYRGPVLERWKAAEMEGKVPHLTEGKLHSLISYLAMIENIDENFGKLEAFLSASGLKDNTVVLFLTDNGGTFGPDYFDAGMRGRKTQLWEGGHRVPCFIRWPRGGLIQPTALGGLTQVQDLLPTLLGLCGVNEKGVADGIDLSPVLRGEAAISDDRMLVINYSRMPFGYDFPSPDSPSLMRREGAAVLWKRWRLLEDRELYDLQSDPMQQTNVAARHPAVVEKMRAKLNEWWNEVELLANEPQPVVIGDPAEDPLMLTACEWLDVFIDQQLQVRRGERKNSWWEVEVARPGEYEFELRRWPREADLPLVAGLPASAATDGSFQEGIPLDIAAARIRIGDRPGQMRKTSPGDKHVTFTTRLSQGRTRLYTWFLDARQQPLLGAYYVYVRRLGN